MSLHSPETKTVRGACPQDCPDTCAFIYHVEDGRLVEVTGDPAHPMTRGGLCVKLKDFAEHHYNPDRILYPMKRVGPKGSGKYERISWDEALFTIKRKWTDIIDQYGSQAIMPHAYLGNQGTANGLTAGDAFFNRLGSTVAEKTYCESGSSTAWVMTVGPTGGLDVESLAHADYIIVWGMNMVSTGTDKLTGFHAAFSNGGVGSNIHAKRYRCVDSGGCQANRSLKSPLRTAARTCNMWCAPWSDHCICCFLTI